MKKTLTIIRGLPGKAKSELAEKLARLGGYAVAADQFPGIYVDGQYQGQHQKTSHEWCQAETEMWMSQGKEEIIVHNTFTKLIFIEPYRKLAKTYGYALHVVHSEELLLPDGTCPTSIHNVPDTVIRSMHQGWEPFNPPPKKGITARDIALQMRWLQYPNVLIFDLDKTIKRPLDGRNFPKLPDDFELVPEFAEWASMNFHDCELYIASNQRGLSTDQKTEDFLDEEITLLDQALSNLDIKIKSKYFAPGYGTYDCLIHEQDNWFESATVDLVFDKPNTGIFTHIHNIEEARSYWIVGDSHTDTSPDDWEFAQNCQKMYPELDIRYVPIELLSVYWSLI